MDNSAHSRLDSQIEAEASRQDQPIDQPNDTDNTSRTHGVCVHAFMCACVPVRVCLLVLGCDHNDRCWTVNVIKFNT